MERAVLEAINWQSDAISRPGSNGANCAGSSAITKNSQRKLTMKMIHTMAKEEREQILDEEAGTCVRWRRCLSTYNLGCSTRKPPRMLSLRLRTFLAT